LFNASFDVLLFDLTSTYFESDPPFPEGAKRRHGYSRDHRPDCVQVVIALVVTPEGLPLAYEVLPGNTADNGTLRGFLDRIEHRYGKARRIWLMDRGVPTEEVLAEMHAAEPPVRYVVGTPKGRLIRLEQALLAKPWQQARPGVEVKLLPQDSEVCVFPQSHDRVAKERAMRRRQLKWPRQWGACWITLRLWQEEFELERRFLGPAELSKRHAAKFVHHRLAQDIVSVLRRCQYRSALFEHPLEITSVHQRDELPDHSGCRRR
jgi:hypothetical protein